MKLKYFLIFYFNFIILFFVMAKGKWDPKLKINILPLEQQFFAEFLI